MKRRKFLTIVVLTASATATGAIAYKNRRSVLASVAKARYDQQLVLKAAPPGELNESSLNALRATTEALLVNIPAKLERYEDYFRFRAATIPGYQQLYDQFTAAVDREAGGKKFADCDVPTRTKIVQKITQTRNPNALKMIKASALDADWIRFDQFIVSEILQLFARTDAFPAIGYKTSPGTARGITDYKKPPI